jgi:hypothetical protein
MAPAYTIAAEETSARAAHGRRWSALVAWTARPSSKSGTAARILVAAEDAVGLYRAGP